MTLEPAGFNHKYLFDPSLDPYLTPKSKPNSNSDDNNDPHLIYEIFSNNKSTGGDLITEKYGITGRQDRPYARPQYQINKFNNEDPTRHYD